MKGIVVVIAGVAAALGLTFHIHQAAATSASTVSVSLKDYRIMLATRQLPVGKPITFVITNRGRHTHEFVLERSTAFDKAIDYHGRAYEADEIKPGATVRVTWTIPSAGTYKFACHIDHHYQKGMRALATAG